MIAPLVALGVAGLLIALATSQKKEGSSGPLAALKMPPEAEAELKKLQQANPTAASSVLGLFVMPPPPVIIPAVLAQYGMSLFGQYPTLAQFLVQRAKEIMTQTTGKSGTVWNTWSTGIAAPDGTLMTHVLLDATPITTFTQKGTDQTTRRSVAEYPVPQGLPADTLQKAHADFV